MPTLYNDGKFNKYREKYFIYIYYVKKFVLWTDIMTFEFNKKTFVYIQTTVDIRKCISKTKIKINIFFYCLNNY